MELQPHQQRLVEEAAQNKDRLDKLKAFLQQDLKGIVTQEEFNDLVAQLQVMTSLQTILERRIARFM
jgi:hypothetical protein